MKREIERKKAMFCKTLTNPLGKEGGGLDHDIIDQQGGVPHVDVCLGVNGED